MQQTTVLVVDPDDEDRADTVELIQRGPVEVAIQTASSLETAKQHLDDAVIDLVVTRHDLGDGTGLELAEYLREGVPDSGCLLYANTTEVDTESYEETVISFVPRDKPDAESMLQSLVEQYGTEQKQAGYPVPDNESERQDAIEMYLTDTDAIESSMDYITDLASQHLGVEVASINIIDRHTQWYLSTTGPRWPPSERGESICTHTLVHEEPTMMVENVGADPRFIDNDGLRENNIVAYLGAKIELPGGHVVGSLCAYDNEPRTFSEEERSFLETLADLTTEIIVLGHTGGDGR